MTQVSSIQDQAVLKEIDTALTEDTKAKAAKVKASGFARIEKRLKSLPKLLRFAGAIALIASAAVFMFQSWEGGDHVIRYLSFLGFTAVLSLAGFFCGLKVKEDKGARTLLALSAAIVPVHFCVLGALIYSSVVQPMAGFPFYAFWHVADITQVAIVSVVGIVLLTPLTFLAFSSLIRKEAAIATVGYLIANAALLIPTREADLIALIAFIVASGIGYLDAFILRDKTGVKTREGMFVRFMLTVPFVLILIRTVHLYSVSLLFLSMLFTVGAIFLFAYVPRYLKSNGNKAFAQGASTLPLAFGWMFFIADSAKNLPEEIAIPVVILPYAAMLFCMSLYAISQPGYYRAASAIIATGALFIQLILFPSIASSFLCIGFSILSLAYGYISEHKFVFFTGVGGFALGVLYHLRYAVDIYAYSPWVSLAITGVATVIAGSYIERHSGVIGKKLKDFKSELASWEA